MARSSSKEKAPTKRYRIYRTRATIDFAILAVQPEWYTKGNGTWLPPIGKAMEGKWKQPDVYIPEPLLPPADIFNMESWIVMRPEARRALRDHLAFYGSAIELLTIEDRGIQYSLINPVYVCNCLNRDQSKFRQSGSIEQYIFYPQRIDHSIFMIPEETPGSFFVAEDMERPYWSLKWQCEDKKLRGLRWMLLWEGDD